MEIGMDDIFNPSDSKDIDIVSHTLCEGLIKSETISENIFETVFVKTENVKIESEDLIKTEDTSDDNGQEVVEVQGKLETDKQQVLNCSNDLNAISARSPKPEHPGKTEDIKAIIKVIKAPVIPVKPHEYITLAKNKHVCNHCQLTCKELHALKAHIRTKHRDVTTMYQCLYCSFKSKWRTSLRLHIFHKHKGTRDNLTYYCDKCNYKTYSYYNLKNHKITHLKPEEIQYFHCYHCSYKCKPKSSLKSHMLMHFRREEIKFDCYICDFTTLKRDMIVEHLQKHSRHDTKSNEAKREYQLETHAKTRYHYCNKCNYKTYRRTSLKRHTLIHLKPEEIQYFYCHHCSFKSKHKNNLKTHIFRHFLREQIKFDCYVCDFMTPKRHAIVKHLKKHFKHRTESDEAKCKYQLKNHTEIRYHYCNKCNYKTYTHQNLNSHKIIHLKPEEIQYLYCYHCSFKSKHKNSLRTHIVRHFKIGNVPFHCYMCDFMTFERELIVGHIKKKHSKVQIKSEINEGS